jgi:hypothetical protein
MDVNICNKSELPWRNRRVGIERVSYVSSNSYFGDNVTPDVVRRYIWGKGTEPHVTDRGLRSIIPVDRGAVPKATWVRDHAVAHRRVGRDIATPFFQFSSSGLIEVMVQRF